MPPIVNQSNDRAADALTGPGMCGNGPRRAPTRSGAATARACRCWSSRRGRKANFVDHTLTDQTSILRFVEDNWELGRIGDQSFDAKAGSARQPVRLHRRADERRAILDPTTGQARSDGSH